MLLVGQDPDKVKKWTLGSVEEEDAEEINSNSFR